MDVIRSFNCNAYKHVAQRWSKVSCPKYSSEHRVIKCASAEKKCSNCVSADVDMELQLDVNHYAWSSICTRRCTAKSLTVSVHLEVTTETKEKSGFESRGRYIYVASSIIWAWTTPTKKKIVFAIFAAPWKWTIYTSFVVICTVIPTIPTGDERQDCMWSFCGKLGLFRQSTPFHLLPSLCDKEKLPNTTILAKQNNKR